MRKKGILLLFLFLIFLTSNVYADVVNITVHVSKYSNSSSGKVYMNGKYIGLTGQTLSASVDKTFVISVKSDGSFPFEKTYSLNQISNNSISFTATLLPMYLNLPDINAYTHPNNVLKIIVGCMFTGGLLLVLLTPDNKELEMIGVSSVVGSGHLLIASLSPVVDPIYYQYKDFCVEYNNLAQQYKEGKINFNSLALEYQKLPNYIK